MALEMVELISRVDRSPGAPYAICDLKYQHFGLIGGRVVMLDADHFYPKPVAGTMSCPNHYATLNFYRYCCWFLDALINSEVDCKVDDDCDHLDCPGKCNQDSKTCSSPGGFSQGTNLRNLCLKIFEGT